jgi:tRNA G10  N-methylase Trm11
MEMLDQRIKQSDIKNLSDKFEQNFFDGIITEPYLGPFYTEEPYYTQVKDKIDNEITPLYKSIFEESYKLLKPNRRISIIAPSISVLDAEKDLRINIRKIAEENNFKAVPLLSSRRIANKSDRRLQFRKKVLYSLLEAKPSQVVKRKIYCFEKE